jgi:nicotinate-nucleotide adenylyltransferase
MKRIGVLAGAFNPVTRAHLALIEAASGFVDETVCVIPRVYPHKPFDGATLEHRLQMLREAGIAARVEVTQGGLFVEIAREMRDCDPGAEIDFICGRDAAERIVTWKYAEDSPVERMFQEFSLLVACRNGDYEPPQHLAHRVRPLPLNAPWDHVSSTEVRRRITAGEPWEDLVPASIVGLVRRIYATSGEKRYSDGRQGN